MICRKYYQSAIKIVAFLIFKVAGKDTRPRRPALTAMLINQQQFYIHPLLFATFFFFKKQKEVAFFRKATSLKFYYKNG